jgi:hypothetical protein
MEQVRIAPSKGVEGGIQRLPYIRLGAQKFVPNILAAFDT